MKSVYIILQFIFLIQLGYATTPPPPHVRYLIVNKTSYPITKIIQIQSDSRDFLVTDTFAIDSILTKNKLELYTERGKDTKKFQRLLVYISDTCFITSDFELLSEWLGYKLTVNSDSVRLEQTSHFKIRKVFSDLLIAFLIVLILKGIGYLIGLFMYIKRIFVEILLINIILTILIYFSFDLWIDYRFPLLVLMLVLWMIAGFSENYIINRKISELTITRIMTISLIFNFITVIVGLIIMIFLRTLAGIIINVP